MHQLVNDVLLNAKIAARYCSCWNTTLRSLRTLRNCMMTLCDDARQLHASHKKQAAISLHMSNITVTECRVIAISLCAIPLQAEQASALLPSCSGITAPCQQPLRNQRAALHHSLFIPLQQTVQLAHSNSSSSSSHRVSRLQVLCTSQHR